MNVIEKVKELIESYDKIADFTGGIHVNFTESTEKELSNYGIYPTGDTLVSTDILGNQKRTQSFVLRAINQSYEDYDRLLSSSFLLDFGYWLEKQKGQPVTISIGDTEKTGEITSMRCANAMLIDVINNDYNNGVMYQIQIYADYSVLESED